MCVFLVKGNICVYNRKGQITAYVDDATELSTTAYAGDINYWNGSAWLNIPSTSNQVAGIKTIISWWNVN